jgi:multiple sugar transport system ATP-binding protein
MAQIKLENINKIYDNGFHAVHDFNLEIKDNEFIIMVGPSGCGKSTTLRMIAGIESISGGTLTIDGKVCNGLKPHDRGISMVFQSYALYPTMTVYDNLAFGLRLAGFDEDEIEVRVKEVSEILGIQSYLARKPKALSGGQQQRVALGRALIRHAKVFLMDEPLSNLDAIQRVNMRSEIRRIHNTVGATTIYVTHDQIEAMTMADRIVVMKDGYIMQVGTPTEVFDRPRNLFVAEFIGAPKMNTFKTNLVKKDGKYFVTPFGAEIPVTGQKADLLKENGIDSQEIILGVRPEHVVLADKPSKETIRVILQVNEMMGNELHLHLLTDDNTPLIVRVPTMNLTDEFRNELVMGKELYITFESKVMHFFDTVTEKSLLYIDKEEPVQEEEIKAE